MNHRATEKSNSYINYRHNQIGKSLFLVLSPVALLLCGSNAFYRIIFSQRGCLAGNVQSGIQFYEFKVWIPARSLPE